jgi:hypothetical protein
VRRFRAISLATIFVAAQVAGFAHNLLVSHVTCPEHGEIIHETIASGQPNTPAQNNHAAPTKSAAASCAPEPRRSAAALD